jgi:hypothetical protein
MGIDEVGTLAAKNRSTSGGTTSTIESRLTVRSSR